MNSVSEKEELGRRLEIEAKRARLKEIEAQMVKTEFWQNHQQAAKISGEFKYLRELIERFEAAATSPELAALSNELTLSGPHDQVNAYLAIHAGSGGTEAQDWAAMLERMYLRYGEKTGDRTLVLEETPGEEAGIKSAMIKVEGLRAYGRLKGENGVHRLVRISPFDADKARHTSFALVEVVPEVERSELAIRNEDLRIDVFRSGGAGGQSVNTTDSAVRITHRPTGLVVTCQNERSQLQNKAQAMKILQAKLELLEDEKLRRETQSHKGEPVLASWGNQIRSYVLQPYQLVKDLRSGYETAAVDDVLDGDLQPLIEAYLRNNSKLS